MYVVCDGCHGRHTLRYVRQFVQGENPSLDVERGTDREEVTSNSTAQRLCWLTSRGRILVRRRCKHNVRIAKRCV